MSTENSWSIDPMMMELFRSELSSHLKIVREVLGSGSFAQDRLKVSAAMTSIGSAACIIQLSFVNALTSAVSSFADGDAPLDGHREQLIGQACDFLSTMVDLDALDRSEVEATTNELTRLLSLGPPEPEEAEIAPESSSSYLDCDDMMLDLFASEVTSNLSRVSPLLEGGSLGADGIETISVAAQSIVGAARIINLDFAAHVAEALLAAVQDANPNLPLLRQIAELLGNVGKAVESRDSSSLAALDEESQQLANLSATEEVAESANEPARATSPGLPAEADQPEIDLDLSDETMLELFRAEISSHTGTLNEGLLALEENPGQREGIEVLMRAAHSMKGAGRMVGLQFAADLNHAMEDLFVKVGEGELELTGEMVDLLLQSTDLMAQIGLVAKEECKADLAALIPQSTVCVDALNGAVRGEVVVPVATATEQASTNVVAIHSGGSDGIRISTNQLESLLEMSGEVLVRMSFLEKIGAQLDKHHEQDCDMSRVLEKLKEEENDFADGVIHQLEPLYDHARNSVREQAQALDDFALELKGLAERLHGAVVACRMRPFADGVTAYPRMVRDISKSIGKQASLDIVGKATQIDRDILQALEAPLTHLIRNALDHGIETPQVRVSKGKDPKGRISLRARHQSGMLSIKLSDDGGGINVDKLKARIVERGFYDAEAVEGLSEAEILEFLFLPAFSTQDVVTELSGRGVGLDIVQKMAQDFGGKAHITTSSEGTTFHILLPISLSVIHALTVSILGETYALKLSAIGQCLKVAGADIRRVKRTHAFDYHDREIPIMHIGALLGLPVPDNPFGEEACVILLNDGEGTIGVAVESFLGESDLVVRRFDERLGSTPCLSAASVTEDGSIALILDVDTVMVRFRKFQAGELRTGDEMKTLVGNRILVVDDSVTVRKAEADLFEANGYVVDVAVDGVDGWNALTLGEYDIVVSDVDMPRRDGLAFVRMIRADDRFADLPVVMVSYKDRPVDKEMGLEAGATRYLTKNSIQDKSLLTVVKELIG